MGKQRTTLTKHFERKYDDMVDRNEHSAVCVAVAKDFGLTNFQAKFQEIYDKHMEIGHIPFDLMEKRYELKQEMYVELEKIMDVNSFNKLRSIV